MDLNEDGMHFVFCPKQGMYFRIFVLKDKKILK